MEVTSNGRFEDFGQPQDATFLCNSPIMILEKCFASLIILFTVHGGKINRGPLPGKFVTVPVALNFLSIGLTVDFQVSCYVFSHSLTYEAQHTFPSFDLCVLFSFPC